MAEAPPPDADANAPSTPHRPGRLNPSSNFTFPPRDAPRSSPSPMSSHRQSFSEQLRGHPSSPRSQRQPSLSQQALQELLNNPPLPQKGDNEFGGRDWRSIHVEEVIDPSEVHWVQQDSSVEEVTNTLVTSGAPNVVLVRETEKSREAISTFDYSDLQRYLLLVVGLAHPDENHSTSFDEIAKKARSGKPVPLRDLGDVTGREMIVRLPHKSTLPHAVEIFASGVHRIVIVRDGTQDVMGVLSQLRLVRFFLEYGRQFPAIEPLFNFSLTDLHIGSKVVRSINGDKPLSDALQLMERESITSLPVLDNSNNVVV